MEKFEKFLEREGLLHILAEHRKRNFPEQGFKETYVRCAKSLVQVKANQHSKIISAACLWNWSLPSTYQLENKDGELQLIWRGSGIGDILVRVFHKQQKTETEYFTNEQGKVTIKLDVPGDYLVNAVHMTEGAFNGENSGPVTGPH